MIALWLKLRRVGKRTLKAHEREVQSSGNSRKPDELCSTCSSLGLPAAMEKGHGEPKKVVHLAKVGFKFRQPPTTDCVLCTILFNSRFDPMAAQIFRRHWRQPLDVDPPDDGDHIILVPGYLVACGLVKGYPFWPGMTRFSSYELSYLAVVPGDFLDVFNSGLDDSNDLDPAIKNFQLTLTASIQYSGAAVVLQDGNHPAFFAPKMVAASFESNMASVWLHYCKRHHSLLCGETSQSPVDGLRLIDCNTLSIIKADGNKPYVALSYVWGDPSISKRNLRTTGQKYLLPPRLSNVILDAITVTKALGFRYFWVDKFCIDQDDPVAKHEQIAQMSSIYENADLTIVAAAGQDETYGLPGVGQRTRTPQKSARLDGIQVILTKRDPQISIQFSRWSTRGWTFQEAALSRRRLVFTDEQMYFECNAMNCFESIYCPLDKMHIEDKSRQLDDIRGGMFGIEFSWDNFGNLDPDEMSLVDVFNRYWSAIENYSSRDLSHDADSLNAFQGIIQRYSKLQTPINAIWGMPYPAKRCERINFFGHSLSWYHIGVEQSRRVGQPKRRPKFPSWTWAGWEGDAELLNHSLNSTLIQSVQFGDGGDQAKDLDSLNESSAESTCRLLRLLAKPLPSSLFSYRPATEGLMNWHFANYDAQFFPSGDCMPEGQFVQELVDIRRWRCICISEVNTPPVRVHRICCMVLELDENTNNWTRVGMILLYCSWDELQDVIRDVDAEWFTIG